MKYGKVILHSFILLTLLLSITAISAADMNDTKTVPTMTKSKMP